MAKRQRKVIRHANGCMSLSCGTLDKYAIVVNSRAGTRRTAHRLVAERKYGGDLGDLCVHHLCGNRGCVNPDHLALVTRHNHLTAHAHHKKLCEWAKEEGRQPPRWIQVVEVVEIVEIQET